MTSTPERLSRPQAEALIEGLVAIPSVSRQEAAATQWLVSQMAELGFDRSFVDDAGNAVGEMGPANPAKTIVLLGHIDTVPGNIPVRVEEGTDTEPGPQLYGRGSVDAKGPLATFTAAVARLGSQWAAEQDVRFVVVGAVEEEAATSKGARFIRDRFDGNTEPVPAACIIGEPSSWQRITLGYKGRLLVEMEASQSMAHTAGPDRGVATAAADFWHWIAAYADDFNQGKERIFDQLQPSLRELKTWTDDAMQDRVWARSGIRLPVGFEVDGLVKNLCQWAADRAEASLATVSNVQPGESAHFAVEGPRTAITLDFFSYEPAWRSDRNNGLVRAFLAAIREVGEQRPSFLVKTGTSDMNVVGPAWGCPIVAYGPGDSNLDHTPNEHLPLNDYWQAILILEQALRHLPALV